MKSVLFHLVTLFGMLAGDLLAAPITFNTALPVAADEFVIRFQFKAAETERGDDFSKPRITARSVVGVLGYGVSPDLTLFALLPYTNKKLELRGADRKADGIADISLFARRTVYKNNLPGRTFRVAPFLGVSLASGQDGEKDSSGSVPPGLQPGCGSTDLFAGLVLTCQTLAWEIDSQLRSDSFGEGGGLEKGDRVSMSVSWQYRIWPQEIKKLVPGFLYLVFESEFSH